MEQRTVKLINLVITYLTAGLVFLVPLFFLPITTEFYSFNKNILLIAGTSLLLILWLAKMVISRAVSFRFSAFDLPLLLFTLSIGASIIFADDNRTEALLNPMMGGTFISLTLLYFIITNNFTRKKLGLLLTALGLAGALLGLITIYQFLGLGEAIAPVEWMKIKTWTPSGGLLISFTFWIPILVILGRKILIQTKQKNMTTPAWALGIVSFLLTAGGTLVAAYQLFVVAKPITLPLKTSWIIAIEAIKNSPLLGTGPTGFLNAFLQYRPIDFNQTTFWNNRFGVSGNFYFHVLTTLGIVGIVALSILAWRVVKNGKILKPTSEGGILFWALVVILVSWALFPANLLTAFLFYLILAAFSLNLEGKRHQESSTILPWVMTIPLVVLLAYGSYWGGRAYAAEMTFKNSLDALNNNLGTQAYSLQIRALELNPNRVAYRTTYAQTNLILANALAANPDLSDQDQATVSQLVQQAIREAKNAISVDPNNAIVWTNLANIYRQLINLAEGADQWTVASYQQAIALEPTSPNLALNLGGVYYSLQVYPEAISWFQRAVNLKSDFANGYYNLAIAYRDSGDYARAAGAMQSVLGLVEPDSGDYQAAQQELEDIKTKLEEAVQQETKEPETLTEPEPLPSPIEEPIELPEEVAPPSPTPTPEEATPSPTPTPEGGTEEEIETETGEEEPAGEEEQPQP